MTSQAYEIGPGSVLAGKYRIISLLGEGGMGRVFLAEQLSLGREVAVKVLRPAALGPAATRVRFEREARVASALRHPGAVAVHDFGEQDGQLYLVMERLHGRPLRDYVDLHLPPMDVRRALRIGADVADVLAAAHAIGLVHRDVKPENVVLEPTDTGAERVVVVDFGLAFIEARENLGRLTRQGVVVGTASYMSPEQSRGDELGPPTDVYALGCMLYELLTAHTPFGDDDAVTVARQIFSDATSIREAYPAVSIPVALDDLVLRMMRKVPEERPTSAEVRDALRALDPSASERKGLGAAGALGRAARMVSAAPPPERSATTAEMDTPTRPRRSRVRAAVLGEASQTLMLALAVRGVDAAAVASAAEVEDVDVVLVTGDDEPSIDVLCARGLAVVAVARADDVKAMAKLVRAGVADVVSTPIAPERAAASVEKAGARARARRKQ